jgi:hypothetical protein
MPTADDNVAVFGEVTKRKKIFTRRYCHNISSKMKCLAAHL